MTTEGDYSSKDVYYFVLSTMEHNTGGPQPAGMRPGPLATVTKHSRYEWADVTSALQRAIERGDVVSWLDHRGCQRYTRAVEHDLQDLIGEQNQRDTPDIDLIERVADIMEDL